MRNRALVALVTIVIAVFGLFAMRGLQQELAPSITFPQAAVVTSYPGAAPAVVANDVSNPVEAAIQSVPGLEQTSSTSNTNSSVVTAQFSYGTDMAAAEQKMTQAINRIKSTLPAGVDPQVVTGSFDDLPIIQFAVTTGDTSPGLADAVRATVLPELTKVEGVRDATLVGAVGQRVTITPDPAKLAEAGLSATAIRTALQQNGILLPGGEITQDGQTLTVSTGTKLSSTQDIESLPLLPTATAGSAPGGGPGAASRPAQIRTIGDVATVELTDNPVTSISYVNGEPALTVAVTKLPAANTVAVSTAVQDALPGLQATLEGAVGQPVTFTTVFDQAPFIQQSIDSLATEGLLGLLFAVLVILVFLLSVRATLVTAISIPTSVLITFIALQAGRLHAEHPDPGCAHHRDRPGRGRLDRRHREHQTAPGLPGRTRTAAVLAGVKEVAGAVTASTITTVAVFLPIAFVGGIAGELFRPFALTVTIALLASLLVALTIIPVLAYWFLKPHRGAAARAARHRGGPAATPDEDGPPTRLQRGLPADHPLDPAPLRGDAASLAVLVLVGTFALAPLMKTNFLGPERPEHLHRQPAAAAAPSLDAQRDSGLQSRPRSPASPGCRRCQMSVGPAGSALRRRSSAAAAPPPPTRSPPTRAPTRTRCTSSVRDALATISDPGGITIAAGGGFGGNTAIEVDIRAGSEQDLTTADDTLVTADCAT